MDKKTYIEKKKETCEKIANYIIDKFNLEPNFNIIELLNKMKIEVIPVESLPANWDYAFNNENNNMKLFYKEYKIKDCDKDYYDRYYRFTLATALWDILMFYNLKKENLKKLSYNDKFYYQGNKETLWEKNYECEHFAACLLMPQYTLESKISNASVNGVLMYDKLMKIGENLGVNPKAICQRCKKLRLIHF